jgi:hypothetical protein
MAKRGTHTALLGVVALAATTWLCAGATAAERDRVSDPYSIMAPEPWVAPKYRSPRKLPQQPDTARTRPARPPAGVAKPAPPTVLPNGQAVPNLPPVRQGIVPGGGTETFGDRAARCAHQSGLYGVPAGKQGTYMHSCTQ